MYLQNHNISIEYPTVIPYTEFEHFGIIRFQVMLGQTDKQTDRQTSTHADSLSGHGGQQLTHGIERRWRR